MTPELIALENVLAELFRDVSTAAWMLWAWNRTVSIARQQLEAEKLATVRAEIDAQIGALE